MAIENARSVGQVQVQKSNKGGLRPLNPPGILDIDSGLADTSVADPGELTLTQMTHDPCERKDGQSEEGGLVGEHSAFTDYTDTNSTNYHNNAQVDLTSTKIGGGETTTSMLAVTQTQLSASTAMEFETNNTSHFRGNTTNLTNKEKVNMLAKGASKTSVIANLDTSGFSSQTESGTSNPYADCPASEGGGSQSPSRMRGGDPIKHSETESTTNLSTIKETTNKLNPMQKDNSNTLPSPISDETLTGIHMSLRAAQNILIEEGGASIAQWHNNISGVHSLTEKASHKAKVSKRSLQIVHDNIKLAGTAMKEAGEVVYSPEYIKFLMNSLGVYDKADNLLKRGAGHQFFTRIIEYVTRLQPPSYSNEALLEAYNLIYVQLGDTLVNLRRGTKRSRVGTVLMLQLTVKFGRDWIAGGMPTLPDRIEAAFQAFYVYTLPNYDNPCRNHKGAYADGANCDTNTGEYAASTCCQWASESAFCIQCKRKLLECPECKNRDTDRWLTVFRRPLFLYLLL